MMLVLRRCLFPAAACLLLLASWPLSADDKGDKTGPTAGQASVPASETDAAPGDGTGEQETDRTVPEWIEQDPETETAPEQPDQLPEWIPVRPEPPERTPQDRVELHVLGARLGSQDETTRTAALERIGELLESGRFGDTDPTLIALLRGVALGDAVHEVRGAGSTGYPLARMKAASLLGRMTGPRARRSLMEVLRSEEEPVVLAAAIRSLGEMRIHPDEEFARTVTSLLESMHRDRVHTRLAMAVLDTVSVLDTVGTGIQSGELYRALVRLALHAPDTRTRSRAYEVLDELRRGGEAAARGR